MPDHTFTIDFFCEVTWEDSDLKAGDIEEPQVDDWEPMFPYQFEPGVRNWTPRLIFKNSNSIMDSTKWIKVYTIRDDGEPLPFPVVCWSMRVGGGCFFERFELDSFPFDAQDLQVQVMSLHQLKREDNETPGKQHFVNDDLRVLRIGRSSSAGTMTDEFGPWWTYAEESDSRAQSYGTPGIYGPPGAPHLVKNANDKYKPVVPHDTFVLQDEYLLVNGLFAIERITDGRTSATRERHPLLILSMKIVRRDEYYVQNIIIPTFLFVVLGFASFAFSPDALGDRLALVSSLLLTAVTYQQHVAANLPKTTDTIIHRHVQAVNLVLFSLGCEAVFVYKINQWLLSRNGQSMDIMIQRTEDVLGLISLLLWIALNQQYLKGIVTWKGGRSLYLETPKTQLEHDVEVEIDILKNVLKEVKEDGEEELQEENELQRYRQTLSCCEKWLSEIHETEETQTRPSSKINKPLLTHSDSLSPTFDLDQTYASIVNKLTKKRIERNLMLQKRLRKVPIVIALVFIASLAVASFWLLTHHQVSIQKISDLLVDDIPPSRNGNSQSHDDL